MDPYDDDVYEMVMSTSATRPFKRSAKGTVVRTATSDQYKDEIADLYDREISRNLEHITLSSPADKALTTKFVSDVVTSAFPGHNAQPNDDLLSLAWTPCR